MSDINPNNYVGAATTLVGYVSGDRKFPAYDPNGERGVEEIRIPVNEGYKKDGEFVQTGTTWYTYTATADFFAEHFDVHKGDKVRIDGAKQEVREYTNKSNETVKAIDLRFGEVSILDSGEF